MEVSPANVLDWNQRPKRKRQPPPKTYWEEYVETDSWYLKEIVRDVPEEEMFAALEDSDLDEEVNGEEGDEHESDEEASVDGDYEPEDMSTSSEEEDDDEHNYVSDSHESDASDVNNESSDASDSSSDEEHIDRSQSPGSPTSSSSRAETTTRV